MSQSGDVLERFLKALVGQITATRPEYLTSAFTIPEIYQDLVPYRSHRNLIGVEMNGDYEDALFRMLSGEGDYLVLDSDVARREFQTELARPNPNSALFHEFAAVEVRLHPSRVPVAASIGPKTRTDSEVSTKKAEVGRSRGPEPEVEVAHTKAEEPKTQVEPEAEVKLETQVKPKGEPEAEAETEVEAKAEPETEVEANGLSAEPVDNPGEAAPAEPSRPEPGRSSEDGVVGHIETASAPPLVSVEAAAPDGPAATPTESALVMAVCHWCRAALPARDPVHFCPFCGSDLRPSPCRECGAAMEARWQFCVSCGADVRG